MEKYNHLEIDKKWQKAWEEEGVNKTGEDQAKPKYYVLDMFPYPSGAGLHVGHPKGYIATDILARYKMMNGFNVLHPMGWDAFGLPAENYALKNKVHPKVQTEENIATYKKQLEKIGMSYDWSREINTTDPEYYKWTQWTFIKMWEKGLAFESFEPIIWCPKCQTGLAMEDLEDGKCERCESEIERKPMRQWVIKITDYADRLLADLDKLPGWEDSIKEMQRNWIGRSEGAEINFVIASEAKQSRGESNDIKVFTTRPDTLFGCTYVVIAPEKLVDLKLEIKNKAEVDEYIKKTKAKSDLERTDLNKDKTGVKLEGVMAINPANGEEVPVFIADYVLAGYGTGAVMAVPAHDERDFEFAKKYDLPIKNVIEPEFGEKRENEEFRNRIVAVVYNPKNNKVLTLNWGDKFGGYLNVGGGIEEGESPEQAARREILEETGYKNLKLVNQSEKVRHHFIAYNKGVNRGTEIIGLFFELIDELADAQSLSPEEEGKFELEWLLASEVKNKIIDPCHNYLVDKFINDVAFTGNGFNVNSDFLNGLSTAEAKVKIVEWLEKEGKGKKKVNYKLNDWVFSRQRYWGEPIPFVHCEKCGVVPVAEKDLPVRLPDVEHYEPSGTGESPLANITDWVNTTCPKCGGKAKRETNTMPQWAGSSWYYLRYIDSKNSESLVDKEKEKYWSPVDFYVGGAEHATRHLIYARFWHKFLFDIGVVNYEEPFTKLQHVGLIMAEDGRKMSKRWGNVINPDDIIAQYGADAMRVYEMFMGPFGQSCAWNTNGLVGARKFLDKINDYVDSWKVEYKEGEVHESKDTVIDKKNSLIEKTIKKVGEDIVEFKFNTAISQMMICWNYIRAEEKKNLPNGAEYSETLERIITKKQLGKLIQILAPFAPHLAEEIWRNKLGNKQSIFVSESPSGDHNKTVMSVWPEYDPELIKDDIVNLVVQINGKLRATIEVAADISEEDAKKLAQENDNIKKWLEGKEIIKIIFIPGKLLNIVVK
ncbi:MAG: leucine--tRNA ligase [Patescibacteria group bacterium]|jgi:leucyl-tRNA synthetase